MRQCDVANALAGRRDLRYDNDLKFLKKFRRRVRTGANFVVEHHQALLNVGGEIFCGVVGHVSRGKVVVQFRVGTVQPGDAW